MPTLQNGCIKENALKSIFATVVKTVTENGMFRSGDRVLVAVSGGPDSVALVHLLKELAPRLAITLGIAHLNHRLRPEAETEARFVERLSQTLALPFHTESQDVATYRRQHGLSIEEAARDVRYAFYTRVSSAGDYQKIALGHHSEDNAELLLMNLLRGAGPLGLSGIPPVREDVIVRPLINLTRAQIHTYLDHSQLAYVLDPSNTDMRFTRNRIRHILLPLIQKEFNAGILDALHRSATITGDENRWLETVAAPLGDRVITARDSKQVTLDLTALDKLSRAPVRRILRRAIGMLRGNLRRVTFAHIETLRQLSGNGKENARVDLPGLISAVKKEDRLVLRAMDTPRQPLVAENPPEHYRHLVEARRLAGPAHITQEIAATGARVVFKRREAGGSIKLGGSGQQTAFFDIDQLEFPLFIRNFRPGDRFTPLGMRGSKKLKKLFNERKVPRADRDRWPVLVCRDEIIWVPGLQRGNAAIIGRQTRHVLEAKYVLPD